MGKVTPASKAPKAHSRNLRLLLDYVLWKLILSLGAPFQRFIFFNLYFCRSCWTLVAEVQRWLLWTIGWLSAPPSLPWLKHLGRGFLQTRRWHFGAGKSHNILRVICLLQLCAARGPRSVVLVNNVARTNAGGKILGFAGRSD